MGQITIDNLVPEKSLIDLTSHSSGDFGLDDYILDKVMDDIILVEFADLDATGDFVKRGMMWVPANTLTNAWRKGKVVLKGPRVRYCEIGDIVMFPNNMGIAIAGIEVGGYGKLKKGLFLNEQRMFGICSLKDETTEESAGSVVA